MEQLSFRWANENDCGLILFFIVTCLKNCYIKNMINGFVGAGIMEGSKWNA